MIHEVDLKINTAETKMTFLLSLAMGTAQKTLDLAIPVIHLSKKQLLLTINSTSYVKLVEYPLTFDI